MSVHLDKLQSHPNNSHWTETPPVVVVVVVVRNDLGLVVLRESGKTKPTDVCKDLCSYQTSAAPDKDSSENQTSTVEPGAFFSQSVKRQASFLSFVSCFISGGSVSLMTSLSG